MSCSRECACRAIMALASCTQACHGLDNVPKWDCHGLGSMLTWGYYDLARQCACKAALVLTTCPKEIIWSYQRAHKYARMHTASPHPAPRPVPFSQIVFLNSY